ncbi:protein nervous wreck isoform X5 [Penaeus vannamei]|uniref:protein nervous wreck isoform X5 n=1 Tax=Penaeus vannamei TaxID=6689 RepID=UPI00387F3CB7
MQPPPRKGNYLKVCKNLHSEQVAKLQAKNQQECDLLEDIRNFTKQRSAIEKSYGEALCKIAANYQNRKIACVPDIRLEDGSDAWNVYSVWRTVLDETEKLGKARLAAVEVFQQNIAEDAKQTRSNKIHLGKKLSEQLKVIQNELQTQVQDLDRTKKVYYEEEHVAHDAREKASAAEEKLKRKKGSIFQSIQSLQKNSAKFSAKRDICDEKSAGARNDYLLALTAANTHQRRYYEIDFERVLRTMECDMYDKVAGYLTLMSRTELLTCSASQVSYTRIREQASTITRGYNLRCYLTFYPMLGQNINYDYEPCEGDKIDKLVVHDETCQGILDNESKKAVTVIQKETKLIRDVTKKLQKVQATIKTEADLTPDVEAKVDELRNIIRKAETNKCKAEAKLELLKEGGIEIEDYSKSLDSDSLGVDLDVSLSRSGSSLSVREEVNKIEGAPTEYENEQQDSDAMATSTTEPLSIDSEKEDIVQQPQQQQQQPEEAKLEPTMWDPINVDWGDPPVSPLPPVTNGPPEEPGTYPKCIVLYNYTAQNPDELSIIENEELELLGEGDGDGWVKARNYKGEVGYIPQNYIEEEESGSAPPQQPDFATFPETTPPAATTKPEGTQRGMSFSSVEYNLETEEEMAAPVSFSSIDYSIEGAEEYPATEDFPSEPPPDLPPPAPPADALEKVPVNLPTLSLPVDSSSSHGLAEYCIAVYDYEATCPEEITFFEGQLIKILKRAVHDVDDGWWEGEVDGQVGLFPSLVVEECRSDGEPLTPDVFTFQAVSGASPCTTPPPHTPPEVPGFLLPPERVIITQPTPEVETAAEATEKPEEPAKEASSNFDQPNFELELSGTQQELYSRQFSSSPESETTEKDQQYAELVSSPDVSNQENGDVDFQREDWDPSAATTPAEHVEVTQLDLVAELEPWLDGVDPTATTTPDDLDEGRDLEAHVVEVCVPPDSPPLPEPSDQESSKKGKEGGSGPPVDSKPPGGKDDGLGVAQIIITAATPMVESHEEELGAAGEDSRAEADQDPSEAHHPEAERSECEGEAVLLDDEGRQPPPPPAPEGPREMRAEPEAQQKAQQGAEQGAEGADSPSPKSPSPSDGPPDLDPEKLKALERIKESNA